MAKAKQLRATMILAQDAKPMTIEVISQMFFGMPFDDAIRAIGNNKNGEFDWFLNAAQPLKTDENSSKPQMGSRKKENKVSENAGK